ncbi:MAG: molybdopterin-dependent oxidoreductase, partial [Synergistaceae bacterium]|nr:molybdopterin-dependent oxidoreductase [Synergistaceae bacterium]
LKWLISNKPVCHYPSYGAQRYLHGDLQFMWIFALTVLSGAFDDASAAFSSGKDEHSLFPENLKLDNDLEIRKLPVGCWGNYIEKINTKLISNAGDAALNTTYYGPPIEVLMIANANPVRQAPNTLNIKSAMSKIPFKVCSDLFMTDTAEMCDLVLPVSSFLEDEDWIGSYWHSYLVRSERVIPRYADSKTDVEIYAGLSAALGQKLDLIEAKRRMDMSILADERLSMVSDRVYLWNEPSYWLSAESKAELPLTIPDHNANNIYTKLQSNVLNATWHRFITVHCGTYINGQSDEPRIGKDDKEIPEIFLNPNIIKELNLSLGQRIKVVSSNGNEIYMRVSEDASVSLKYAYAYQGNKTINLLTNAYEAPGSGAPYAECFVRIIV